MNSFETGFKPQEAMELKPGAGFMEGAMNFAANLPLVELGTAVVAFEGFRRMVSGAKKQGK